MLVCLFTYTIVWHIISKSLDSIGHKTPSMFVSVFRKRSGLYELTVSQKPEDSIGAIIYRAVQGMVDLVVFALPLWKLDVLVLFLLIRFASQHNSFLIQGITIYVNWKTYHKLEQLITHAWESSSRTISKFAWSLWYLLKVQVLS